jgi:hypothetical protein
MHSNRQKLKPLLQIEKDIQAFPESIITIKQALLNEIRNIKQKLSKSEFKETPLLPDILALIDLYNSNKIRNKNTTPKIKAVEDKLLAFAQDSVNQYAANKESVNDLTEKCNYLAANSQVFKRVGEHSRFFNTPIEAKMEPAIEKQEQPSPVCK